MRSGSVNSENLTSEKQKQKSEQPQCSGYIMILALSILSLISCAWGANVPPSSKPLDCSKMEKLLQVPPEAKQWQSKGDKFSEFDWDLVKELNKETVGNLIISPISLKVVLAMLYEGAKGQTAKEIGEALNLLSNNSSKPYIRERFSAILKSLETSKGEYNINMGTHVFIDHSAQPNQTFQCKLRLFYDSEIEPLDFQNPTAAADTINQWASNVTEGNIKNLITEAETSSTIMLLLNAVYFKGYWQKQFDEKNTSPDKFHLDKKKSVSVPMMRASDDLMYVNMPDLQAEMIRLPYKGGKFAMYVILPKSKTGLKDLVASLGPEKSLASHIARMQNTSVHLSLPKFEFDFTTSLRPALEKLNMKTMFSPSADLSDMAQTKGAGLVVTNVLQKAGISVTEIGTEAYAATEAVLTDKFGGDDDAVKFTVNRPFLFFIEDEIEHTVVFVGKVRNPEEAKVKPIPPTEQSTATPADTEISSEEVALDRFGGGLTAAEKARFNFFDAELLKQMGTKEPGNFIISPASIKTLLGLMLEGAVGNTETQIKDRLQLPEDKNRARELLTSLLRDIKIKQDNSLVNIDLNNQMYVNKGLSVNASFARKIQRFYEAGISQEDFSNPGQTANNINQGISRRTKNLINDVIKPDMISPDTYALLLNTLYFEGTWVDIFSPKDTKPGCFYSTPDVCEWTPMMSLTEYFLNYKFDSELDSHVLNLRYHGDRYSMVIVMPDKKDGMRRLTHAASRLTFPALLKDMRRPEINLRMPKFTMEYGKEMTSLLKEMGLDHVFSENAELPNIIQKSPARVDKIVHKAKIEVSEEGTKAAAATGGSLVPLMSGPLPLRLDLDHPFYYFIYARQSESVLFAGRLSSVPGAEQRPVTDTTHVTTSEERFQPASSMTSIENDRIRFPNRNNQKHYRSSQG